MWGVATRCPRGLVLCVDRLGVVSGLPRVAVLCCCLVSKIASCWCCRSSTAEASCLVPAVQVCLSSRCSAMVVWCRSVVVCGVTAIVPPHQTAVFEVRSQLVSPCPNVLPLHVLTAPTVCHELRNPLHVLKCAVCILEDTAVDMAARCFGSASEPITASAVANTSTTIAAAAATTATATTTIASWARSAH